MCEQMGWTPNEEDMPVDTSTFSLEVQQALLLLNILRDRWDSMSGTWMGKDYSGLSAIMDIYEIDERRQVFELLQVAEQELGKYYSQKQKENEAQARAKRAG